MNPLSPFTYYIRHKGQALLLLVLIGSLTLGVYTMVSLTDVVFESMRHTIHYLTRMSRLLPNKGPTVGWVSEISTSGTLDQGLAAQIRAHEDVAAVIPENGLYVGVPMGMVVPTPVLGLTEADLPVVMEACDLQLKKGRMISPRTGEIVLSEEIVRALDLSIGDQVSYKINEDYYRTMATELTLVGILDNTPSGTDPKVWAGFVSYEYLDSHELYQPRATNWIIIARPGSRVAVNDFAAGLIDEKAASSMHLQTFEDEMANLEPMQRIINGMYGFVDGLVAVAAALVVGMVHRIAVAHRLPELGLLQATGHHKQSLVRRLVLEVATIAAAGWAIGLVCAYVLSTLLNITFFIPQGLSANVADPAPLLYTLPMPLIVIVWINVSVHRTLKQLDPVAIVERGKLSMEATQPKQTVKETRLKPLSPLTFLTRHRSRSILQLAAVGLMVLGVALPGFLTAVQWDAILPLYLSYATHTTIVSPGLTYTTIAPDVIAQIRAHPAVAYAIPVKALAMVVNIPMAGESPSMPVYGVREQDLPILLDVYGLRLEEGQMVQPRSNNLVLTSALAQNRDLHLGDAIGYPVHELDGIPTELTVVGMLEPTGPALVERAGYDIPSMPPWAAFTSYEYVDGHERYAGTPTYVLAVPVKGREAEMETWLQETIASPRVNVETLGTSYRLWQTNTQTAQMVVAISLIILTAVAGLGLATLNAISFAQRRDEFGILHATGHNRAKLTMRALRENVSIMAVAWLAGAAICIIVLFYAQAAFYAPLGTRVNMSNATPWLFTLPIPVAVIAASAGTTAWTLSRLDPVAVIERR